VARAHGLQVKTLPRALNPYADVPSRNAAWNHPRDKIEFRTQIREDGVRYSNMNITLTPELEQLVQTKVARGEYDSAETFVSEAVQRLIDEESIEAADHGEIRARIEAAEAEIDGGGCIEYDETTIHELVNGVHDRGLKLHAAEREDAGVRG